MMLRQRKCAAVVLLCVPELGLQLRGWVQQATEHIVHKLENVQNKETPGSIHTHR